MTFEFEPKRLSGAELRIIDEEHRSIHHQIALLIDAISLGSPIAQVEQIGSELVSISLSHFEHEERVLGEIGFEAMDSHRAAHEHAAGLLREVAAHLNARQTLSALRLLRDFRQWLHRHLSKEDELYRDKFDHRAQEAGLPSLRPRIYIRPEGD